MRTYFLQLLLLALPLQATAANSDDKGYTVNATRVIFEESQSATTLSVTNHYPKAEFLVQSWVDDGVVRAKGEKAGKAPFLITPPLFLLPGKTTNEMRIVRTGGSMPEDRESVFWINVKFVPKTVKSGKNVLSITVKNRLKLFWRPKALEAKTGNTGYEKLTFRSDGGKLMINNPSSYFVTLSSLTINGKLVKQKGIMLAPKTETSIPSELALSALKGSGQNQVEWRAINDYGARTEPLKATF
ncbi:molecular chaperone [Vibrio parahaemolyticus]|nr:molecular chaperone [Vibrio parahaemolyticus]